MKLIDIFRIDKVEIQYLERREDVLVRTSDKYGFTWFSGPLNMEIEVMKEKISKILYEIQELGSKKYEFVKEIKL